MLGNPLLHPQEPWHSPTAVPGTAGQAEDGASHSSSSSSPCPSDLQVLFVSSPGSGQGRLLSLQQGHGGVASRAFGVLLL